MLNHRTHVTYPMPKVLISIRHLGMSFSFRDREIAPILVWIWMVVERCQSRAVAWESLSWLVMQGTLGLRFQSLVWNIQKWEGNFNPKLSGEAFDDLEEMNLAESDQPSTMVFWRLVSKRERKNEKFFRYTCPRPCLGTNEIPGRNGHITSFITRYGDTKSRFHGYPLLGGTKTAMRSFFNFTRQDPIQQILTLLKFFR